MITLLPTLCILGWLLSATANLRHPGKTTRIGSIVWWSLALVNLVVVNSRWDSWFGGDPVIRFSEHVAPWTLDYLIIFFFTTAQLAWWSRRFFTALPDARQAARIAIGVYHGLLLSGFALLAIVK